MKVAQDQVVEFLKHLRSVHFGMLLVCLLVAFAASQKDNNDIGAAKTQQTAIFDASRNPISSKELLAPYNYRYLLRYVPVNDNEKLIDDFSLGGGRTIEIQSAFYIASDTTWLVEGYNVCDEGSVREVGMIYGGRTTTMFRPDGNMEEFVSLWDNLGKTKILSPAEMGDEVVLVRTRDQKEVRAKRSNTMTYEYGSPVLVPCTSEHGLGFNVVVADLSASDLGYEIQYLRQFDAILDHDGFNPKIKNLRPNFLSLSNGMPAGLAPRDFAYEFPDLASATANVRNMTVDEIGIVLELLSRLDPPSVGFSGIDIPFRAVVLWGAILILLFQSYFLFHLVHFVRMREATDTVFFPWIATYPNLFARLATVVSSCIVPVGVIVYLLSFRYFEVQSHRGWQGNRIWPILRLTD